MTTPWAAIPNASPAGGFATRALISAIVFPFPQDGLTVFCAEPGFQAPYVLSLNSGAAVDGTNVLSTTVGGTSRWLKGSIGAPATTLPAGFAGGRIASDGSVQINVGIDHVVHVGPGRYDVFLSVPTPNYLVSIAIFDQGPRITHNIENAANNVMRVTFYDSAGAVIDSNFYVVFFKTA